MNVSPFFSLLRLVKLHFTYEGTPCSIQLDFDANCSVGDVIMQLKEIYQIPPDRQIQLSTYDNNEILAYGIKIAELILLNPHKYKKLQIVHSYKTNKYTNYEQSSLVHKEVPKIEYDGTISRYSDDNKNNNNANNTSDGSKYHNHKRNYNMNINKESLPSTYRTNNNGNNFYYENKTYDEHNNNNNNINNNTNMISDELKTANASSINNMKYTNNEQQQRLHYYTNNNNNNSDNNNVTGPNRSNSFNYSHTPMNNYNRSFNYKYSRTSNQNSNSSNTNTSTNVNVNQSDNEDLLYNNIDIHPRPNTSSNFHSHWNNLSTPHI